MVPWQQYWQAYLMGQDGLRGVVLLFVLANLHSVLPVCNQGFSHYLQFKGLKLNTPTPHENQQEVSYSCGANREIPNIRTITSTCIGTAWVIIFVSHSVSTLTSPIRHIGRVGLPECQCSTSQALECQGASFTVTFPSANQRTSSILVSVPGLESAAHWRVGVRLSFSGANASVFDFTASGEWTLSPRGGSEIVEKFLNKSKRN